MGETEDLVQLRQLNLQLLRQLWAGQEAVRRAVAQAASESSLDSSSCGNSEMPSSPETSLTSLRTSYPEETHPGGPWDTSWPCGASSGESYLPPGSCHHWESLGGPRPCSAPLVTTSDSTESQLSTEQAREGPQEAQALRSILAQQSNVSKPRVTFRKEESPVPERNWRLRPYLGYDWIAGSLDSSSPVTNKPEAFFSELRNFRDAHQEECVCSDQGSPFLGLRERGDVPEEHQCVYCYRVNRRLFLVPSDPGAPCRLCRLPRGQRGPETLARPAQVRVSVPLSILEPPYRHHIHRRKSFDASDTLALPRHCLLGWDVFPPKPEKSSAPKSLDLWSCIPSEAQHRKLSATGPSCLALPTQVPSPMPTWSEPQVPRPHASRLKP
ncbi:migration and invasion-inhibitory protein [Talpa occidentalis]|uniref:migration and invasion-inhibitory protein n=1 Tax=Talpa occidentalis TaxID=50954 RepID=UPI00188DE58D|nr:migration and invasion-inhibitory protein [Talpa occidentalis]XP_037356170.1 migration and invasion-inhibitory protein [Talpa occidentalis]